MTSSDPLPARIFPKSIFPSLLLPSVLFEQAEELELYSRTKPLNSLSLSLSTRIGYESQQASVYLFGSYLLNDEYTLSRFDNSALHQPLSGQIGPSLASGVCVLRLRTRPLFLSFSRT
jgi:hypothetical protein